MAFTTIDNPELYFQTKLYTGNSSTQSITLDGSENMQPDWVWIKARSDAGNHAIYDSVRGATKRLTSEGDNAESTVSNGLTAFNSDGFSLGAGGNENSATNIVAWNWKAGSSVSGNTTGSGTAKSYTGSVSTTAGFSIISFTGNGTSGHTIPHNLGVAPAWVIVKRYDSTNNWRVGHNGLTSWQYRLTLELTDAQGSQSAVFNSTAPSSSVVTLGNSGSANGNGATYIMYSFAEKKGYSKFGSYTGNGNADGPMIFTGFKPAWVMIKNISSNQNWVMFDNKRPGFNVINDILYPNQNDSEQEQDSIDFLSNGFKIRVTGNDRNGSGNTLVYMAFAESPFTNSSGTPNNAR